MDMIKEDVVSYSKLSLEFPTKVLEIKKLKIIEEFNEHGIAVVELIAVSKADYRFIDDITPETDIKIAINKGKGDDEEITPIFIGIMTKVSAKKVDKFFDVTLELKDKSFLMDLKLKDRSFQNVNMTYDDLFKEIIKAYPTATIYDNASSEKTTIDAPIIQFRETDYLFLKRIASRLGTGLIPNVRVENPTISIGKLQGDNFIEDTVFYTITKDIGELLRYNLTVTLKRKT